MITFKIDGKKPTDWHSFHSKLKSELSFPDYYGEIMNAWIDCVDELTEQPTLLQIESGNFLKENKPELLNAILECGAFVNYKTFFSKCFFCDHIISSISVGKIIFITMLADENHNCIDFKAVPMP